MPFGELRSASQSGGCCYCNRCGSRLGEKRELQALRWLCGLGILSMVLLALPVLYLIRAKAAEKPEEIVTDRMPAAQKLQGNALPNNDDSTIWPSFHARVNPNDSPNKCANEKCLPWEVVSEEGPFQLDKENVSFTIPKDGRYFVYSQVTFSCSDCDCGMKKNVAKNVWQRIEVKPRAYPQTTKFLMSATSMNETNFIQSLYLAGVRPFKKDDQVMVNVSNPGLVVPGHLYTFFGAYFIS
ncbi:tumor necrosis factor ligand superfamily member 15 [Erythrolamprus reginae]|uniref:tumor necrosis factor ligand superfamily member 15 n=1 Tax=Erythrolamprus reginae TaxID=121349 RepID=UPI00396CD616